MTEISIKILDMECAACVARLDRVISRLHGVFSAQVNFTASSANVVYDENETDIAMIRAYIKKAGFRVPVEEQDLIPEENAEKPSEELISKLCEIHGVKDASIGENGIITVYLWPIGTDARELVRACLSGGYTVSAGESRGGDEEQELTKRMGLLKTLTESAAGTSLLMLELHPRAQFVIGTALQFGPGRYFYKGALRDLRNKTFGMDTLVSLSSTLIYLYSSYITFTRKRNFTLYFGSDGVLLSLILFGKYIEQMASGEASATKETVGNRQLLDLFVCIQHCLMGRKQTVVESLYYGHRKNDQSVFVRLEGTAKQIRYIPDYRCLLLYVRAYDGEFIVSHVYSSIIP